MADGFSGPVVVCVRGASRSGKSTLCESLIRQLAPAVRVAWAKRTHHYLDLPYKASGRVWASGPAAMVVHGPDRLQVTLPTPEPTVAALFAALPVEIDLILLETHEPEPFPTLLSRAIAPAPGERVIGHFTLESAQSDAEELCHRVRELLPDNLQLARMVRLVAAGRETHVCPESVAGARLLLRGVEALEMRLTDITSRLQVTVETSGCASAAIHTLCPTGGVSVLDHGKLAATFSDRNSERTVRLAVRGAVCRELLSRPEDSASTTIGDLTALDADALFTVREVAFTGETHHEARRGPRHVTCVGCGEEVFGGRAVATAIGTRCIPCSAELCRTGGERIEAASWR